MFLVRENNYCRKCHLGLDCKRHVVLLPHSSFVLKLLIHTTCGGVSLWKHKNLSVHLLRNEKLIGNAAKSTDHITVLVIRMFMYLIVT